MFNELILKIQNLSEKLDAQNLNDIVGVAALIELQGEQRQRIFAEGEKTNGGQIGPGYSQNPFTFEKEQFVRQSSFKANTKDGKMFIAGGYEEFRKIQSRPTDKVYLKLSGSLERSLNVSKIGSEGVYGCTNQKEATILNKLEKQYGRVFSLNENEKELLKDRITVNFSMLINNG